MDKIEEEKFTELAELLLKEQKDLDLSRKSEKLRQVLLLLVGGAALITTIVMPGTALLFKGFLKDDSTWREWKKFNGTYLRRTIRKLEQQKLVEIVNINGRGVIKLTENGRQKVLDLNIGQMAIPTPTRWDRKWRIVFYDVENGMRVTRDHFQKHLKALGFYPFQESVYLFPYPCDKEIEFLRHYLGISGEVRLVVAEQIENDKEFRAYFGLPES